LYVGGFAVHEPAERDERLGAALADGDSDAAAEPHIEQGDPDERVERKKSWSQGAGRAGAGVEKQSFLLEQDLLL